MSKKLPLRNFHNDVLFQFEDKQITLHSGKLTQRGFEEKTKWGFTFCNTTASASSPRWGHVVLVGPDTDKDIFPGRRVLVENLKWTVGFNFEGERYWKTTDEFIIGYDDEVLVS